MQNIFFNIKSFYCFENCLHFGHKKKKIVIFYIPFIRILSYKRL